MYLGLHVPVLYVQCGHAKYKRPVAAISITLPLQEFTTERETAIAALLKETARKTSLQFGHNGMTRGVAWP